MKIRLNKLVIRSMTFWASNVLKDRLEARARDSLSSFLLGVLRLTQATQNMHHVRSRVVSVQRARRTFSKNWRTRQMLLKVMFYQHMIYLVKFYQKKAKQVAAASPAKKKGPKDRLYSKIFDKLVDFLQLYTDALKRDQPGLWKLVP